MKYTESFLATLACLEKTEFIRKLIQFIKKMEYFKVSQLA